MDLRLGKPSIAEETGGNLTNLQLKYKQNVNFTYGGNEADWGIRLIASD